MPSALSSPVPFTKVHGLGNDFILIDALADPRLACLDYATLAPRWCDRHRSIGADGVLVLCAPTDDSHARMRIVNSDGSEGGMCGNGIRCVSRHMAERRAFTGSSLRIQTGPANALTTLRITIEHDASGRFAAACVNMGQPILDAARIPVAGRTGNVIDMELAGIAGVRATCVSMGNPHAVMFVDDVRAIPLETLGPAVERHPAFPQRANAQFVQVVSNAHAIVRTWERGAGPTLACGTGACAVLVAGVLTNRLARTATISLPGGDLAIRWDESTNHIYMTGPAEESFAGVIQPT